MLPPLLLLLAAGFVQAASKEQPVIPQPVVSTPAAPALDAASQPLPEVDIRNSTRHWSLTLASGWTPEPTEVVNRLDAELERLAPGRDYRCVALFVADAARGAAGPNIQVHVVPGDYRGLSLDEIDRQLASLQGDAARTDERNAVGLTADQASETPPVLDRERLRITTSGEVRLPGRDAIRFRTTAMIGATGLTKLIYYAPAREFDANLPAYTRAIDSFTFDDGYAYEPRAGGFLSASNVTRGAGSLVGIVLILVIIRSTARRKAARTA